MLSVSSPILTTLFLQFPKIGISRFWGIVSLATSRKYQVRFLGHLLRDNGSIQNYDKGVLHMAEAEYLPGGIRERMEDLRNRCKLALKEVSEKTGIDYSTLSRIENGNVKKVGDDVLLKLARFFGVSTDYLLGITNVPDKKNYTIEELGLTPEAARNLYTGAIENRVINLLLVHPDFATLTNRIADYLDDRMAAGIAAQNQLYDSVSELMMRIGKEEKALRQAATTQAKEAKALRRKLYADELAQIETLFKSILSSIKKSIRLASRRRRKP